LKKQTKEQKNEKIKKLQSKTGRKSSEPQTMEDLLSYYTQKIYTPKLNDKVKGKIIKIEPGRVAVDIGAKSEGLIAEKAYKEAQDLISKLKVGDEINAFVIVTETRDGYTVLSLRNSVEEGIWEDISKSQKEGKAIKVICRGVSGAGLSVDVGSLTGFIPTSQIGKNTSKKVNELPGKSLMAVVIDFDKSQRKIVLSEKQVSEAKEMARVKSAKDDISLGGVFDGVVTSIYDFGVFVKITPEKAGPELEGLVHVSEMSWEKISTPASLFKIGDKVKIKVIGKSEGGRGGDAKLAFSIKQAQGDPWDGIEKKYKPDTKLKGTIVKMSDYGAFVAISPGLEGLIHITKIPPDQKLRRGDEVNVYIENIDVESKKISLGLVLSAKPMGYK